MPGLEALQRQFIQVLQGENPDTFANAILNQGQISTLTRIEIYRNAYYQRLKESVEVDHEILGIYLGDALFEQMVAGYVSAYPSKHTSLRYFSEQLPGFLADNKPFSDYPVLSELARFERLLLTAFDAPDAEIANRSMLSEISTPHWPNLQFRLHPSVQLYQSDWNAVAIWQALKQQETPPSANTQNNYWLIWRNTERLTEFTSLNDYQSIMLDNMINGTEFAVICERLAEKIPAEHVSELALECLVNWINQGIISKLSLCPEDFQEV